MFLQKTFLAYLNTIALQNRNIVSKHAKRDIFIYSGIAEPFTEPLAAGKGSGITIFRLVQTYLWCKLQEICEMNEYH